MSGTTGIARTSGRSPKNKKSKSFSMRFLAASVMLLALMAGAGFYWATWVKERIEYARIEPGVISHEQKVEAVFANTEVLLQAPSAGKVSFYGKDGDRFRRGAGVAQILSDGAAPGTVAAGKAAIVSAVVGGLAYQEIDGLETVLTPDHLLNMDLAKLLEQTGNAKKQERVQAGEAFAKIVDNFAPTYAFVHLPKLDGINTGKNMNFRVAGEPESAKILRKSENPLGVVLEFPHFLDSTVQNRRQSIDWVTRASVQGLLVPKTAVFQQGDKQGVYAVVEGVIRFKVVEVLDEDADKVCVKGLQEGGLVIANPKPGLEGKEAVKN